MNRLSYLVFSFLLIAMNTHEIFGQEYSPISFRLHLQPQVSSLNPYDPGFISNESLVSPSFAFGLEASWNLSKQMEISVGYQYSSQAGNYQVVFCDQMPGNLFSPTDSRTIQIGGPNCPLPRERLRLFKLPLSLGWRFIQKEKFMSRISAGPQLQASLNPSSKWYLGYKKFSAAFMAEWSNYFKISKNFSLVTGLRLDRGFTPMDSNSLDRTIGNSLGLIVGAEYTFWTERK